MFVENVIQTLSRGILSSFILVSLISPASTYPLHKQQLVKQESWQVITAICRVDFENRVRFFSDDAFRICSKESCPLTGEPGPFGDRCRPCCQNKANATTGENGEEGVKSSGHDKMVLLKETMKENTISIIFVIVILMLVLVIFVMGLKMRQLKKAGNKPSPISACATRSPAGKLRTDLSGNVKKALIANDNVDTISGKNFEHTNITQLILSPPQQKQQNKQKHHRHSKKQQILTPSTSIPMTDI